jgi:hypothetical protein
MTETTMAILTQYPFQVLLMGAVLSRLVRDALEALRAGRMGSRLPIGTATRPQAA